MGDSGSESELGIGDSDPIPIPKKLKSADSDTILEIIKPIPIFNFNKSGIGNSLYKSENFFSSEQSYQLFRNLLRQYVLNSYTSSCFQKQYNAIQLSIN